MNIKEYDTVALIENVSATHKENRKLILLKRGQVGTVMMEVDRGVFLIDFADIDGNTYAMETITEDKLMVLNYEPIEVYT